MNAVVSSFQQHSFDQSTAVRQWIEWLAAGECTEEEFISEVLADDADVAWEVLAQIDQLYRRRRIGAALFTRVRSRLQRGFLGFGTGAAASDALTGGGALHPAADETIDNDVVKLPQLYVGDGPAAMSGVQPAWIRLRTGDVFAERFRVEKIIERTEDGLVFEATDLSRPAAPLPVNVHLMCDRHSRDIEVLQRLYRLQALDHAGMAKVIAVDEEEGELYCAIERPRGTSLQVLLRGERPAMLSRHSARGMLGTVAAVLMRAHAKNACHGALGAGNVFVSDAGEVRLHGFVMGPTPAGGVTADHVAFARMAYELLWQCDAPGACWRAEGVLQQPPSVTRSQWAALRATLHGDLQAGAKLLQSFAGDAGAAGRKPPAAPTRAFWPWEFGRTGDGARGLALAQ